MIDIIIWLFDGIHPHYQLRELLSNEYHTFHPLICIASKANSQTIQPDLVYQRTYCKLNSQLTTSDQQLGAQLRAPSSGEGPNILTLGST